ncbi:MAG: ABC transporter permease [Cyclobacteriaceae bacterium]|nr:ABC transporter permease [Cyclobacteriaceae bacterium]
MLKNYLTITFRNVIRNRSYTFINVAGLSVGIAACLVTFLVISFELSFEKFHAHYDRLYCVARTSTDASGTGHSLATPYPFAAAFRTDFPDIPLNTQIHHHEEAQVILGDEKHKVKNILFADSLFFDVFSFEVLSGNPRAELGTPGKVFLTQSLAGKIMKDGITHLKLSNKLDLEIAGIVKDPPPNSHIKFSMIVSMPSFTSDFLGLPIDQWGMISSGYSYVVLPDEMTPLTVENRFEPFVEKYQDSSESEKVVYHLQPVGDIHFDERYGETAGGPSYVNRSTLVILGLLGGFILLVACINFINLSTALAVKKSREIGVRKTLGASRGQLVFQYLSEAFMLTVISTLLAVVITEAALPFINSFLQKELLFRPFSGLPAVFLAVLVLVTTLLSGLYPAFVLSGFSPIAVLKNKLTYQGTSGAYARKYLVVFQFLVAQMLIIGTLVVADQMEFLNSKPLGFAKEAILNVSLPDTKKELRESFQSLLETIPEVEKVSFSVGAPTSDNNLNTSYHLTERGNKERYGIGLKLVDRNYLETYGMELAAGRWFTENEEKAVDFSALFGTSSEEQKYVYIVNEALVRQLGFSSNEDIIGKNITTGLNGITAEVVGVVKDFHIKSLHHAVEPVALLHFPYFYYDAGIRFNTAGTQNVLNAIEEAYAKVFPDYLFEYSFLDAHLENLYQQEKRSFALIRIFAGLAIFISCLGLLGLVSFLTQQKIKEVGIRKVFGASVTNIVFLFSKSFITLIVIAFVAAVPLAWYGMNSWLEGFAYRTSLNVSVFVVALLSTLVVAMLTVIYQSMRAAVANPVDSLRSE